MAGHARGGLGRCRGGYLLSTPAVALDQRRPIELLSTAVGAELVEQLLTRIEYGVYT